MARKPQNHVTRELEARKQHTGSPFPGLSKEVCDWFRANYPPRCYDHRAELIEDHLKYAGVAQLGQTLQLQYDERLTGEASIDADAEVAHKLL